MAKNPVVIVYTGEWDEVTLDTIAGAVDPETVEAAVPLSPGEPTGRVIVTEAGGRVIDGHDQIARLLRWCEFHGSNPSGIHVRVLLASSGTAMKAPPATQGQLPGIHSEPLLNWGATRVQPTENTRVVDPAQLAGIARFYKDTAYDLMARFAHGTAKHGVAWESFSLLADAAETGKLPTWAPPHLSTIEKIVKALRDLGAAAAKKTAPKEPSRRPDGCPDCGGGPDGQGGAGFKDGSTCMSCRGSGWKDLKAWRAQRDARLAVPGDFTPASPDRMLVCPRCGLEVADRVPLEPHRPGVGNVARCPGTGELPVEVPRSTLHRKPPELVAARSDVRRLRRDAARAEASATRAAKKSAEPTASSRDKGRATQMTAKNDAKRAELAAAESRVRDAEKATAQAMSEPPRAKGPRFPLGKMVATPAALEALVEAEQTPLEFVRRHVAGDWGDVSKADAAANDAAVRGGERLLSAYSTRLGTKLWIITEADRSATTVLLPSDY